MSEVFGTGAGCLRATCGWFDTGCSLRGPRPVQAAGMFLGRITSLSKGCSKHGAADEPGLTIGHLSVVGRALKQMLSCVN